MISIKFIALQTSANDSLKKKNSPRERKGNNSYLQNHKALPHEMCFSFLPLLFFQLYCTTKFMIFFIIIEAKIYLEQDSRTVCVAVLHSLAVET